MQFKSPKAVAAAQIVAEMKSAIAKIEAFKAVANPKDLILSWDNGLAVGFKDGNPFACGVLGAAVIVKAEQINKMPEEAWAYIPIVKNGYGNAANLIELGVAIDKEIAEAQELQAMAEVA